MATVATTLEIRPWLATAVPYSATITGGTVGRMNLPVPSLDLADRTVNNGASAFFVGMPPPPVYAEAETFAGRTMGNFWFNLIHILPRRIDAGNILTTQVYQLDIYNAFVYQEKDLESFINNAGAGTNITDLPSLPYTTPPLESLLLTLEVTPDGAPTINTTLDFDTEESYLLSIPITGTRIVMFPYEPEAPLGERLSFLTEVMEHKDGTEQRVGLRYAPRQEFDFRLLREDGPDRQRIDLLIFDWQNRVFGVPIWVEPSFLTADVTASQTSISVTDTTFADFRTGGLAIIYEAEDKFDALEIESFSTNTITFKTPISNNYEAGIGIRVMPLRTCITSEPVREKKYANNLAEYGIRFRVLDNDVDLSDVSGWPTYNGKVLLSDPNAIELTLDGTLNRQITVFDGSTGKFSQASTWNRSRHASAKTFIIRTRSGLWAVRKLLHALRGRQVSFYLPTFTKDLTLASPYASGAASIIITNVGYARYGKQRTPKVDIRIILKDGTIFTRTITNSAEVDAATEQLTLSATIGQNIDPDDVSRIEFLEKVRIDTDDITIQHADANGTAKVGFPVKGVLE